MDPQLLLLAALIITDALMHIVNLITRNIPTVWKTAFVSLLHKGGLVDDLNNYCPIFKLPCLAKILERLVNNQLKIFLSTFNILDPHQSGYRFTHSNDKS